MKHFYLIILFSLALSSCVRDRSLENIRERKQLNALVRYNSTDYFIYKGYPMGFQLELLKMLSAHLGVELYIIPMNDLEAKFDRIPDKDIDLVAGNMTVTDARKKIMCFTHPLLQTRQVLVQRSRELGDSNFISSLNDLAGKTICVPKGSVFDEQADSLKKQIGKDFVVASIQNIDQEELIAMVSSGEILYTVADENVAAVCATSFFDNIDFSLPVSEEQDLAWAVDCRSDSLRGYVDTWIDSITKTLTFALLYHRYYTYPRKGYQNPDNYSLEKGRLPYDDIIKKHAERLGWDWRLLAALICQESNFLRKQVSWAGAIGLMQLMPEVAKKYNITLESPADAQILAGVKHLQVIDKLLPDEIVEPERTLFIIASYNVGVGHIMMLAA
jgi:membrane-bound lytic murein transglycosylase F